MSDDDLRLAEPLRDEVKAYLEPRAADVDAGRSGVRPGLAFLHQRAIADTDTAPDRDLARVAGTIATAAWSDMATAFSLWCHRMVLEYLAAAPSNAALGELRDGLLRLERIGSTGLAPAMAHVVHGAPLPMASRRHDGAHVLDGVVPWASNLFAPDFVLVTAARTEDGGTRVFAVPGGSAGFTVEPYPALLALQATASSRITVRSLRLGDDLVLSSDLAAFLRRVRPTFLILQTSFCWGLARRALDETAAAVAAGSVLASDLAALETRAAEVASWTTAAVRRPPSRPDGLVRLRLDAARLATEAVALELKAAGSRAYARSSPTARRLREAAFLPIQAPTEAQLRTELGHARLEAAPA